MRNYTEAMRWYRMAADQGNDLGQYNIGNLYANGLGVPRDLGQARQWWRKAAASGNDAAKQALAKYGG
jgi:TPR repeat protein